jgi:signal transduction histidine kinase
MIDSSADETRRRVPSQSPQEALKHLQRKGDGKLRKLTLDLAEAGLALGREHEKRNVLEDVLHAQNQVLVRTLNSMIAKESEPAQFLEQLLNAISHELEAHSCSVWSLDPTSGLATLEKTVYNGNSLTGLSQLKHPLAGRQGRIKSRLFAKAVREGPVYIADVSRTSLLEPDIRRWMSFQKVTSLLCVPLRFGKKVIGALNIRGLNGGILTSKSHMVYALSNLVTLAITLTRMLEQEEQSIRLKERSRLAAEIHDSLSQNLSAAVIQLEAAEGALGADPAKTRHHLGLAKEIVRTGKEDLRRSVWALRPLALEGHNLPEALHHLVSYLNIGTPLRAEFVSQGKLRVLSADLDSNLLRIAQEAVTNAIRHAHATKVKITLANLRRKIVLTIEDDGQGFKTRQAEFKHGSGLVNMRERAAGIGALFSIRGGGKSGTQIKVTLPIPTF